MHQRRLPAFRLRGHPSGQDGWDRLHRCVRDRGRWPRCGDLASGDAGAGATRSLSPRTNAHADGRGRAPRIQLEVPMSRTRTKTQRTGSPARGLAWVLGALGLGCNLLTGVDQLEIDGTGAEAGGQSSIDGSGLGGDFPADGGSTGGQLGSDGDGGAVVGGGGTQDTGGTSSGDGGDGSGTGGMSSDGEWTG